MASLCVLLALPGSAADLSIDQANELYFAGEYEAAVDAYRAVAATYELSDPTLAATARNNACVILMNLGNHRPALKECHEAVRLRRDLGDEGLLSRSLNNLGLVLNSLGSYAESEVFLDEALELNRNLGDAESQAVNLENLASLATDAGQYDRALKLHEEVAALANRHSEDLWASEQRRIARINQGAVLEKLGAYREALDLYRLAMAEEGDLEPGQQALLQVNIGVAYRNLGDPVEALQAFESALRIYENLSDTSGISNSLLNMALVRHLNLGDLEAAERHYRRALEFAESAADFPEKIQDLFYLGRLLLQRGRIDDARQSFELCLEASEESGSAEGRWSALEGLGRSAAAAGDPSEALRFLEMAIGEVEALRSGLSNTSLRSGYFGERRPIYAAAVRALASLETEQPNNGYGERALEIVQKAKSRDLLDALGPDSRALVPLDVTALQESVGQDLLLEYFIGERDLYLWIITRDEVRMVDLGPFDEILSQIGQVHTALSKNTTPEASLIRDLSETLLSSVAIQASRPVAWRIAPDGRLHYLPFELLEDPGAPGRLVIDEHLLTYLPSASVLAQLDTTPRDKSAPVLAFGNPHLDRRSEDVSSAAQLLVERFRLEPLQFADPELTSIRRSLRGDHRLWTGSEATEEAFRREVSQQARVVHLAAHTVVDERPGGGAAILLTPSGRDDGLLFPHEIAELDYDAALTVLAACRTALASQEDGRTLATLTGAFLAAGSAAVVATLWDVEDAAVSVFMDQFYYQLGRGEPPASALRKAKLALRADPNWDQPSLWAAYVLVGDYPHAIASRPIRHWIMLLALVLATAAILGISTARRRRARESAQAS